MTIHEQESGDCRDLWGDRLSADIAETIGKQERQGANTVNIRSMQGDIINLGALPPQAIAEFLASRRRSS